MGIRELCAADAPASTAARSWFPLSHGQQALWFVYRLRPEAAAYNAPVAFEVSRHARADDVARALHVLTARHPMLRAVFSDGPDGTGRQAIRPTIALPFSSRDVSDWSDHAVETLLGEAAEAPFDLTREAPWRALLLHRTGRPCVFLWVFHHLIVDGASLDVLLDELGNLWQAGGDAHALPPAPAHDYTAFVQRQAAWTDTPDGREARAFWQTYLTDAADTGRIPTDLPRPDMPAYRGAHFETHLPEDVVALLADLGRRYRFSASVPYQVAWTALLCRYAGHARFLVGTPIRGGLTAEFDGMVGYFGNTLPLCGDDGYGRGFGAVCRGFFEQFMTALSHADWPLSRMTRADGTPPVLHAAFSYHVWQWFHLVGKEDRDPFWLKRIPDVLQAGEFPLSLEVAALPDGPRLLVKYDPDLFLETRVRRLVGHYLAFLEACARTPEQPMHLIPLGDAVTRAALCRALQAPAAADTRGLYARIAAWAQTAPERTAVRMDGHDLTYGALPAAMDHLIGLFAANGLRRGDALGILGDHRLLRPVAVAAALCAGLVYVPLDAEAGSERLAFMVTDAGCAAVLADPATPEAADLPLPLLPWPDETTVGSSHPPREPAPEETAYCLYTSGSTGRPKGVVVTHGALIAWCNAMDARNLMGAGDVVSALSSPGFDISFTELLYPLTRGACIDLLPRAAARDSFALAERLHRGGRRVVQATPTALGMLTTAGYRPGAETTLLSAGEALRPATAEPLVGDGARLWNLYGPTEATIYVSGMPVTAPAALREAGYQAVPLGTPFAGVDLHLVDAHLQPLPEGVVGELLIGGATLARGYHGRPALTAERFLPHPFSTVPGARVYRVGDRVCLRRDAAQTLHIAFLGRADTQLKIRGHRIEPGEIEARLAALPGVSAAAVVARGDNEALRLVAYAQTSDTTGTRLREALEAVLPAYMVPDHIVTLPVLPRLPAGKVHLAALPDPEATTGGPAPSGATARLTARIWAEVLQVDTVYADAHFFHLGGHSPAVIAAVAKLRAAGLPAEPAHFFRYPRLSDLAGILEGAGQVDDAAVAGRDLSAPLPLTPNQHRLWFLEHLHPGTGLYHMPLALRLSGPLDIAALERALHALEAAHPALRTRFILENGRPYQETGETRRPRLVTAAVTTQHQAALLLRAVYAPFDLEAGTPWRCLLLRFAPTEHLLLLNLHHLIADGATQALLLTQLADAYRGRALPATTPEVYAAELWAVHDAAEAAQAEPSGRADYLKGTETEPFLATDSPRPHQPRFQAGMHRVTLPPHLATLWDTRASELGVTPFLVGLTVFALWQARSGGQWDFCIGVPVTLRRDTTCAGFFATALPLRLRLDPHAPFSAALMESRRALARLTAMAHLPLDTLVAEVQPPRIPARHPLFTTLFTCDQLPIDWTDTHLLPGITTRLEDSGYRTARFDLTLNLLRDGAGTTCLLEYDRALWAPQQAAHHVAQYLHVLTEVLADPAGPLHAVPLMAPEAATEALTDAAGGEPVSGDVSAMVADLAKADPEAPALAWPGGTMTRGRLADWTADLTAGLQARRVIRGQVVAVCAGHDPMSVPALLAVLHAGATYLPLDPAWPDARLALVLEAARPDLVLATAEHLPRFGAWPTRVLPKPHDTPAPAEHRAFRPDPQDGAYLIFTSGSTGTPKGVLVPHAGLANLATTQAAVFGLAPTDRVLRFASPGFDASISEVCTTLVAGACLVSLPEPRPATGPALAQVFAAQGITAVTLTPSVLAGLPDPDAHFPRILISAGEACTDALTTRFGGRCRLINAYGPTEATVCATMVPLAAGEAPHLGGPMRGTDLYLLDPWGRPVPVGVPGMLYLGGPGLARGYLGAPARTAAAFVPHPFSDLPGARLYRTGDLGRRTHDGRLIFLGRADAQVKIRGCRVEPEEPAAVLRLHPLVAEAVVLPHALPDGTVDLAAYVTARDTAEPPSAEDLRRHVAAALPAYMVPTRVTVLDAFPRTASGKLDTASLKPAAPVASARPPATALQKTLHDIWCTLLQRPAAGLDDTFFDLGGHSLLLPRLQHAMAAAGFEVDLATLFQFPTLRAMADHLAGTSQTRPQQATAPGAATGRGDLAVVGFACRLPGAPDATAFWQQLHTGGHAFTRLSADELAAAGVPETASGQDDYVPVTVWLDGIETFDAAFFAMSPREAELTDPQHRLLLECAWSALEHAGTAPRGGNELVGLFAGSGPSAYLMEHIWPDRALCEAAGLYTIMLYHNPASLTSRIAFKLNLKGPAVTLYTACSTSLAAVTEACHALRQGRCSMALAGGVSLQTQRRGYHHEEGGVSSPTGLCRPFDAAADGTVIAGGVGLVALMRARDAEDAGYTTYALIKGCAANNDGDDKVGFTAPSVHGQAAVIRAALADADVPAASISYVEAHGTGTPMGDPIEIAALAAALGTDGGHVAVGSVKGNIGHLDAAAGVAGLLKTVLMLHHGRLVVTPHTHTPSPRITWGDRVRLCLEAAPWTCDGPRRAGVSSFGTGGTNVHVVLEEAPRPTPTPPAAAPVALLLSARTASALTTLCDRLADFLTRHPDTSLTDVAHTLRVGRTQLAQRCVVTAATPTEAAAALRAAGPAVTVEVHPGTVPAPDTPQALAALWLAGYWPSPEPAEGAWRPRRIALPGTPFERTTHWLAPRAHAAASDSAPRYVLHPQPIDLPPAAPPTAAVALLGDAAWAEALRAQGATVHHATDWEDAALAAAAHVVWAPLAPTQADLPRLAALTATVAARSDAAEVRMTYVATGLMRVRAEDQLLPAAAAAAGPLLAAAAQTGGPRVHVVDAHPSAAGAALVLHPRCPREAALRDEAVFALTVRPAGPSTGPLPWRHGGTYLITGGLGGLGFSFARALATRHGAGLVLVGRGTDPAGEARLHSLREAGARVHVLRTDLADAAAVARMVARAEAEMGPIDGVLHCAGVPDTAALADADAAHFAHVAAAKVQGLTHLWQAPFAHKPRLWVLCSSVAALMPGPTQAAYCAANRMLDAFALMHDGPGARVVSLGWDAWAEVGMTAAHGQVPRGALTPTQGLAALDAALRASEPHGLLSARPLADIYASGGQAPTAASDTDADLPMQTRLAAIWAECLGGTAPAADASFTDLGGDSLTAARLLSRIRERICAAVRLSDILEHDTLADMADAVAAVAGTHLPAPAQAPPETTHPLTPGQLGLWAYQQRHPEATAYHLPAAFSLEGDWQRAEVHAALDRIVAENACLRTRYVSDGDVPTARVWPHAPLDLWDEAVRSPDREALIAHLRRLADRPFALDRDLPIRVWWVHRPEAAPVLLMVVHHLAFDGVSLALFMDRLAEVVGCLRAGKPIPEAPAGPDFGAFARAHQEVGAAGSAAAAFWRARLARLPEIAPLQVHRDGAARASGHGLHVHRLPAALMQRVDTSAQAHHTGAFTYLLAAYKQLLYQVTGASELVVGCAADGRDATRWETMMGYCVNPLPLRTRRPDPDGVDAFLATVRTTVTEALDHRDYPFSAMADLAGGPIMGYFFNMQHVPDPSRRLPPGLTIGAVPELHQTGAYDLIFDLQRTDDGAWLFLRYDRACLPDAAAASLAAAYDALLDRWTTHAAQPLPPQPAAPVFRPLHLAAEATAMRCGDRPALIDAHGPRTYADLVADANALAASLAQHGIGPGDTVALYAGREASLVTGLLACLTRGACYVPLDTGLPAERLRLQLAASGARAWLGAEPPFPLPPDVCRPLPRAGLAPAALPAEAITADTPAYMIFTSGTTGTPKGVVLPQGAVANYARQILGLLGRPDDGVYAMVSTPAADLGLTMLYGALCGGGTLSLVPEAHLTDPEGLATWLATHGCDYLKIVPGHLEALCHGVGPERLMPRRALFLGGEASRADWVARLRAAAPGCRIFNHYGPTEACVGMLTWAADAPTRHSHMPLGRPIGGTSAHVLDRDGRPVPQGFAGELHIGGYGLAQGYTGRPGQTAAVFVPDAFSSRPGARLYRTGDKAVVLEDGTLYFLGRIDRQLKIRGYRVEPAEVEAALASMPQVGRTALLTVADAAGHTTLAAVVAPAEAAHLDAEAVRGHLAARLPDYMVPSRLLVLPTLPVTPNGKVDRKALAALCAGTPEGGSMPTHAPARPMNRLETLTARIWAEVLNRPTVAPDEDFFALGGHSLNAITALAKLRAEVAVALGPRALYQYPTPAAMAAHVATLMGEAKNAPPTGPMESPTEIAARLGLTLRCTGLDLDEDLLSVWHLDATREEVDALLAAVQDPADLPDYIVPAGAEGPLFQPLPEEARTSELWHAPVTAARRALQQAYESADTTARFDAGHHPGWAVKRGIRSVQFATVRGTVPVQPPLVLRALNTLIAAQPLLRCRLEQEGEGDAATFFFREKSGLALRRLPLIDLSDYAPADQPEALERVQRLLYEDLTADVPPLDVVLYGAALVKLSARGWVLILAMDHIIADYESKAVVAHFLDHLAEARTPWTTMPSDAAVSYARFTEIMTPAQPGDPKFDLLKQHRHFVPFRAEVAALREIYPIGEAIVFSSPVHIRLRPMSDDQADDPLGYTLMAAVHALALLFDLPRVPLRILVSRRFLGGHNFYHTIGDFHDSVPVLFEADDAAHTAFSNRLREVDHELGADGLSPSPLGREQEIYHAIYKSPFNFNYLGDISAAEEVRSRDTMQVFSFVSYPIKGYKSGDHVGLCLPHGLTEEAAAGLRRILADRCADVDISRPAILLEEPS